MPTDNKKVDGIKKASKEELEKSRNIVLATIGEFDKKNNVANIEAAPRVKKVDSIQPIKEAPDLAKDYKAAKKSEEPDDTKIEKIDGKKKQAWREDIKRILPEKKKEQNKTAYIPEKKVAATPILSDIDISPPEPIIQQEIKTETDKKLVEEKVSKINPFKNEIVEKKIKEQEALAKKEAEDREIKKQQERENLLKMKLSKEKIAIQKLKAKQAVARIHKKKIKKFINDLRLSLASMRNNFWRAFKLSLVTIFAAILVLVLLYSILAVAILKFNFVNGATTFISDYLPVPAFITSDGIVEYGVYDKIRTELQGSLGANVSEADIKVKIAEKIIYEALIRKYNLDYDGVFNDDLKKNIAVNLVKDAEINQVGIYRIQKIKSLISKGENFVTVSNKYGDDQDLLTITDQNNGDYPFAEEVSSLEINQVSDVILSDNGYYIFRCYDKDKKQIALSYVFVNAKTLDQYLKEAVLGYKMWSLVE